MRTCPMPKEGCGVWGVGCREWCRELIISPKSSSSPKPPHTPHPTPYTLIREPNSALPLFRSSQLTLQAARVESISETVAQ
ncbi:MAG: hypothetical protein F6J93_24725 [Oscillatoria sp. SIO1A7]|nr:hypothetical protein [Oscillatoria sp. SIO1A7]